MKIVTSHHKIRQLANEDKLDCFSKQVKYSQVEAQWQQLYTMWNVQSWKFQWTSGHAGKLSISSRLNAWKQHNVNPLGALLIKGTNLELILQTIHWKHDRYSTTHENVEPNHVQNLELVGERSMWIKNLCNQEAADKLYRGSCLEICPSFHRSFDTIITAPESVDGIQEV